LKKRATLVIFNTAVSGTGEKEASNPVTGGKGKVGASPGLDGKVIGWPGERFVVDFPLNTLIRAKLHFTTLY